MVFFAFLIILVVLLNVILHIISAKEIISLNKRFKIIFLLGTLLASVFYLKPTVSVIIIAIFSGFESFVDWHKYYGQVGRFVEFLSLCLAIPTLLYCGYYFKKNGLKSKKLWGLILFNIAITIPNAIIWLVVLFRYASGIY